MALIEKRAATRADLKWFGLLCLCFFGLLGSMSWLRHGLHTAPIVLWCIGVVTALLYYSIRPIQRPIYMAWNGLVYPISWVVSHLLMVIVFYGVITPIGLLMRLFGWDPMCRRLDRSCASYWVEHDPGTDVRRYFHQS